MSVTASNNNPVTNTTPMYVVRCRAHSLYLLDYKPARASVELSGLEKFAIQWKLEHEASDAARTLRTLFPSFDWQAVPVRG